MASTARDLTLLDLAQGLVEHLQCPSHLEADEVAPDALQRRGRIQPPRHGRPPRPSGGRRRRRPPTSAARRARRCGRSRWGRRVPLRCGASVFGRRRCPGATRICRRPSTTVWAATKRPASKIWISSANWWTSTTRRVRSGHAVRLPPTLTRPSWVTRRSRRSTAGTARPAAAAGWAALRRRLPRRCAASCRAGARGDGGEPIAKLDVQVLEIAEATGEEEEVLAHVAERPLHLSFGLRPVGPAGARQEAIVGGQRHEREGVVDDVAVLALAGHRGLHAVVEDLQRHAARAVKAAMWQRRTVCRSWCRTKRAQTWREWPSNHREQPDDARHARLVRKRDDDERAKSAWPAGRAGSRSGPRTGRGTPGVSAQVVGEPRCSRPRSRAP